MIGGRKIVHKSNNEWWIRMSVSEIIIRYWLGLGTRGIKCRITIPIKIVVQTIKSNRT